VVAVQDTGAACVMADVDIATLRQRRSQLPALL
jgi:hypothetical protein